MNFQKICPQSGRNWKLRISASGGRIVISDTAGDL